MSSTHIERDSALHDWLSGLGQTSQERPEIEPVAGDASTRRYFRIRPAKQADSGDEPSRIVMDAPPPQEDSSRFVRLAEAFADAGVRVPAVLAHDAEQGFALLEDFGDHLLLDSLNADNVDACYGAALQDLLAMQQACDPQRFGVPAYDRALLTRELGVFSEWLLGAHLGIRLDREAQAIWQRASDILIESALSQPSVLVHRDFHSRNLLLLGDSPVRIGVIDFQDAVAGPITYDLVSLLRDCYIAWPPAQVDAWMNDYFEQLRAVGKVDVGPARFKRWFDLMGMQRHLKAAGIFARLQHRDARDGYLADIPRTLGYVEQVCAAHPDLHEFGAWLLDNVLIRLDPQGRVKDSTS